MARACHGGQGNSRMRAEDVAAWLSVTVSLMWFEWHAKLAKESLIVES